MWFTRVSCMRDVSYWARYFEGCSYPRKHPFFLFVLFLFSFAEKQKQKKKIWRTEQRKDLYLRVLHVLLTKQTSKQTNTHWEGVNKLEFIMSSAVLFLRLWVPQSKRFVQRKKKSAIVRDWELKKRPLAPVGYEVYFIQRTLMEYSWVFTTKKKIRKFRLYCE